MLLPPIYIKKADIRLECGTLIIDQINQTYPDNYRDIIIVFSAPNCMEITAEKCNFMFLPVHVPVSDTFSMVLPEYLEDHIECIVPWHGRLINAAFRKLGLPQGYMVKGKEITYKRIKSGWIELSEKLPIQKMIASNYVILRESKDQ